MRFYDQRYVSSFHSIFIISILIASCFLLTSCNQRLDDREIRGQLTVNPSAMSSQREDGKHCLYVPSTDQNISQRCIFSGQKIIELIPEINGDYQIKFMDSRRTVLASLKLPKRLVQYNNKTGEFLIRSSELTDKQAGGAVQFDIHGQLVEETLRVDRFENRYSKNCTLRKCPTGNCRGLTGSHWLVTDFRRSYRIVFKLKGSEVIWATFEAKGDILTTARSSDTAQCLPLKEVFKNEEQT